MNYTDVFGTSTIPPSEYSYAAVTLSANTTFDWPQIATGTNLIASLMEVTSSGSFVMTMPAANQVSTANPTLIRNVGTVSFDVVDSTSGAIATIAAGIAKLIYIKDNSTAAGVWGILTYGTGSSAADAATLAGQGTTAISTVLGTAISVSSKTANWTVATTDRSILFAVTSGTVTCALPSAATAGNNFFISVRNSGTGTVTIDPDSSETIDGVATLALAPNESVFVVCSGTFWYTIGYGRSTEFQFTKLVKSVTAGGSFTLTSAEASNKLLQFTGAPTTNVTIVVPNIVSVYYTQNAYSGSNTTTVKTAAGASVTTAANTRSILYCDGTDVFSAQTSGVPASSIAGGVAGAVPYQTASDLTAFTASGTAGQALLSGGAGAPTWSFASPVTALTSSGNSVPINLALSCNFSHSTTENTTLATPSNPVAGQSGVIVVTNTGGHSLSYSTFWKFQGGTIPALDSSTNSINSFIYYVNSASNATCAMLRGVQ